MDAIRAAEVEVADIRTLLVGDVHLPVGDLPELADLCAYAVSQGTR